MGKLHYRCSYLICVLLLTLLATGSSEYSHAQELTSGSGVRSAAMGHASASLRDVWSALNNPAGLAATETFSVGVFAEQRFAVEGIQMGGLALALPIKDIGVVGIGGRVTALNSTFTRQRWGLSVARSFGPRVMAGLNVQLSNLNIQGYGSQTLVHAQAGLQYQILSELRAGLELSNPSGQRFSETTDERMPTSIQSGIAYRFSDKLLLALEAYKVTDRETRMQSGLEYRLKEKLALYSGFQTNPFSAHFGAQIELAPVRIGVAIAYHEILRATPIGGVDYISMPNNPNFQSSSEQAP